MLSDVLSVLSVLSNGKMFGNFDHLSISRHAQLALLQVSGKRDYDGDADGKLVGKLMRKLMGKLTRS